MMPLCILQQQMQNICGLARQRKFNKVCLCINAFSFETHKIGLKFIVLTLRFGWRVDVTLIDFCNTDSFACLMS